MNPDDSSNWTFVRAFLFVAFSENQFLLTISLFTFIYEKIHEKVFEKSKSAEKFPACLKYFDGKINIQFPIRSGYHLSQQNVHLQKKSFSELPNVSLSFCFLFLGGIVQSKTKRAFFRFFLCFRPHQV